MNCKNLRPPPEPLCVMKGNMSPVHCLLFDLSPEKELLLAGTQNGLVHMWNLQENREHGTLKCGNEICLMMDKVDNLLVTQDRNCNVKIWEKNDINGEYDYKNCLEEQKYVTFCKMEICVYNNENSLLLPGTEGEIKVYSVKTCKLLHSFKRSAVPERKLGEIMALKTFPMNDALYLLVAYEGGSVLLWHVQNSEVIATLTLNSELPTGIDFSVNKQIGVCGTNSDKLYVFNVKEGREICVTKQIPLKNPGVNSVRIRSDDKIFVAGCWDGKLRIFSFKTFKLLAVLEGHQESILFVLFSPCCISSWNCKHLLVAGGMDKKVSLWDIYN